MKEFIGAMIRTGRKNKEMTQEDLAAVVDLSVQAISNLERGETLPNLQSLVALSNALNIPIQNFFTQSGNTPSRDKKEAEIIGLLHELDDRSLDIAIKQIQALRDT
ncbi:helix-turn-helix domain-containing protein [Terasakiella pusilla]|jgi:transcriptional regulator with XRE-family HTH domain|uniref:helix-turn-helix domain-containing protein n=1 Tax=Terasakiella pusilla TaxID=64973 RepID=UPI000691A2FE|nr:helix-turn-helix transcriptional regulator [Terasakiella pusilla]